MFVGIAGELKLRPFLRWAGGKQRLIKEISEFVPSDIKKGTYFEPFLGGGSLFWLLQPPRAFLSDLNRSLIECYKMIRDEPNQLYEYLKKYKKQSSCDFYFKVRKQFNQRLERNTIAQSARFFYLNRTSFNGIFRVNQRGLYNVPYDANKNVTIPSRDLFRKYSDCLKSVDLEVGDYCNISRKVAKGDFVYLDPPYPPLNGTAYFTHYTKDRFNEKEQKRVAVFAEELSARGVRVLISNAATKGIFALYAHNSWRKKILSVTRVISCKAKREKVNEVLIYNY